MLSVLTCHWFLHAQMNWLKAAPGPCGHEATAVCQSWHGNAINHTPCIITAGTPDVHCHSLHMLWFARMSGADRVVAGRESAPR
jgi:hypothetical protein